MRNKYKGQDVKNRLSNTVIRYRNNPVFCKTTEDGLTLNLFSFKNRSHLIASVDPEDPNIDISSLSLGYLQFNGIAVYVKRMPRRIYKQGIDVQHLDYKPLFSKNDRREVDLSTFFSESVFNSLMDKFSSLTVAITMMTKSAASSVALNKNVAVMREGKLLRFYIKGYEVGFSDLTDPNTVHIPSSPEAWVHSVLLEEINGIKVVQGL